MLVRFLHLVNQGRERGVQSLMVRQRTCSHNSMRTVLYLNPVPELNALFHARLGVEPSGRRERESSGTGKD